MVASEFAPAPASMLSPSSKYKAVSLSIIIKTASAGHDTVLAILIGEPPDFVIATVISTALVPSIFATMILLILKTFPDDDALARISVVKVVFNSA